MKNFLHTLLLIAFAMCVSVNAQTSQIKKATQPAKAAEDQVTPGTKAAFIKAQNYLAASSLKSYTNAFGDSLTGFSEEDNKADLLSRGSAGQEFLACMQNRRRQFVNQKYNLMPATAMGRSAATPGASQSPNNNTNNSGARIIGGNNSTNSLPCVNEGFEQSAVGLYNGAGNATAITGWTLSSYTPGGGGCINLNSFLPGTPEAWIVNTPILGLTGIGTLPHSPLGGTKVLQLNDFNPTGLQTKITQTFPVTSANTLFQFAYAGVWNDGGHTCCDQPALHIAMYQTNNCVNSAANNAPLTCSSLSLNASGASCPQSSGAGAATFTVNGAVSWTNWQVKYIDLTPFVGTCVTIEIINGDCTQTAHYGVLYFDTQCGGQLAAGVNGLGGNGGNIAGPVSYCAGSNQAIIAAPLGYAQYQWVSPTTGTIAPSQGGAAPNYTIINPVPNSVYTVNLTTGSGCHFTSTNTITTSNVNIAAIGAGSTCAGGGASGTATVVGNGSGTGYTYNWVKASNGLTVGSTSVVTNLAAGLYSVTIGGLGVAGCGNATGTVMVGVSATPTTSLLKPYCPGSGGAGSTAAYLAAPLPGSNYHWYNGSTIIAPNVGGAASSYTVLNPVNNSFYWLSYLTTQGCQDSVRFQLYSSNPGALTIPNPGTVCPGGSNGSPTITVFPAAGSPTGQNAFTVTNISAPTYSAAIGNYGSNDYSPTGLSAGTYSVSAFDGSCKYGATFNVTTLVFNFLITPNTYTLCSGTSTIASLYFPVTPALFQYTYQWTPSTFLSGSSQSLVIVTPTIAPGGLSTIIYTATATSSLMSCPVSQTVAVTVINPAHPTFAAIPNLCDNSSSYSIVATPSGGTYSTSLNPGQLINPSTGVITPTFANIGVNTFTYNYGVNICTLQATGSFTVSHYNTPALTSTIAPICVNGTPVDLMNIVQNTVTGIWTGPNVSTSPSGGYTFTPAGLLTGVYTLTYSTFSSPVAGVCNASFVTGVNVTALSTPSITGLPQICTNHIPFTMTATPSGGGWSGNGVPTTGIITPSLLTVGNNIITYTVADGPCINTRTYSMSVVQFNDAGFTGGITDLCTNNSPFDLNSVALTPGGIWSGPGLSGSAINPSAAQLLPPYIYTHTYNNGGVCTSIATITANITPTIQANIVPQPPRCNNGAPFQLAVSPATGSWVPTQFLTSGGLFTPSLSVVGANVIQYVIGTQTCNAPTSAVVNIEAFVPAAITTSLLPDICITSPLINLNVFALNTSGSWTGQGVSGISFNPAISGQGNFVLTHHTASSPSGLCPDQAMVSIHVFSLQAPVLGQVGPFCNSGSPMRIQPSPAGGIFGGANSFAITNDGLFNPALALIGNNIISYSITSGPCIAYANATISVEKFIPATLFSYPEQSYCKNTPTPLGLNQFVQNQGGTWHGTSVGGNSTFNFANSTIGKNAVYYTTTSYPTTTLCPDVSTLIINVADAPHIDLGSDVDGTCSPVKAKIYVKNTNVLNGIAKWTVSDGTEGTGPVLDHTFTAPGSYTVVFNLAGSCPVQVSLDRPIVISENPKVNFSFPDEVLVSNPEVQFTNLSMENNTSKNQYAYQWKFSNGYTSTEVSPTVTFALAPARYTATLTATNIYTCKSELVKIIDVKNEFNIFIPTSFTPNFDGLNDFFMPKFTPYGLDEKTYEMEIFDRWGSSLFRTKDPAKGWDGSVQNKGNDLLKEDVYVYRIKYKDLEGNVYSKVGHISLIK